jgi:hypothetical protein
MIVKKWSRDVVMAAIYREISEIAYQVKSDAPLA